MDHVVQLGDLQVGVANQRVVKRRTLSLRDIGRPAPVILDAVDRQADYFGVALVEFGLQLRQISELGGAHRGEILRVRKQDRPTVAYPFMKADLAFRRLGGEIGNLVTNSQAHCSAPLHSCRRQHA
jgi:hypothetical protein